MISSVESPMVPALEMAESSAAVGDRLEKVSLEVIQTGHTPK